MYRSDVHNNFKSIPLKGHRTARTSRKLVVGRGMNGGGIGGCGPSDVIGGSRPPPSPGKSGGIVPPYEERKHASSISYDLGALFGRLRSLVDTLSARELVRVMMTITSLLLIVKGLKTLRPAAGAELSNGPFILVLAFATLILAVYQGIRDEFKEARADAREGYNKVTKSVDSRYKELNFKIDVIKMEFDQKLDKFDQKFDKIEQRFNNQKLDKFLVSLGIVMFVATRR